MSDSDRDFIRELLKDDVAEEHAGKAAKLLEED